MSRNDQLKYWLGLVNIGLDQLISVRIGWCWFGLVNIDLDQLILVCYPSILVDISLDGLNVKSIAGIDIAGFNPG